MDISQLTPDLLSGTGSKSQQLFELLESLFKDGTLADGDLLPPETEIARLLQVSRGTVRHAFDRLVKKGLCQRRRGHGTFSTVGQRYRAGEKRSLPTLLLAVESTKLPVLVHPFFDEILVGIRERAAHRYALEMAVVSPSDFPEKAFGEASVVILLGHFTEKTLERVAQVEKPVLSLQFRYRQFPFSSVCVDNEMAGYLLTRHLIEAGAQEVRYFCLGLHVAEFVQRAAGVQNALYEASLPSDRFLVNLERQSHDLLAEAVRQLEGEKVDAVIGCRDILAIELLSLLKNRTAAAMPVRVAGFDDLHAASFTAPQLTSVHQPTYEVGAKAVDLADTLLSRRQAPRHLLLPPTLMVRASSLEGV